MTNRIKPILVLSTLLTSTFSFALPEDRNQPVHVSADSASIDEKTGITLYQGDVVISQGSLQINADQVKLYRSNSGIDRLVATGRQKAAHFRQKPAQDQPWTDAWGQTMEYDVSKQSLTISGNGKVQQGKDRFSGERIVYNIKRSIVNAFGGKQGKGRIQMIIQPRQPVPASE
ncbi:MAG: lipopolysaccharide transport periplasmic protein LptA [Marinobacterium sp.]|nr:lipopolysaccharide transport periplasmic protein LptA [Marinobacterium sp.]